MNIVLVTNGTPQRWTPQDLEPLAGGEESVVLLARAWAQRGYTVTVQYDGEATTDGAVTYQPWGRPAKPFDVAVFHNVAPDRAWGRGRGHTRGAETLQRAGPRLPRPRCSAVRIDDTR